MRGIRLGRHLFFDERLSGDNTQSCNSCHLQESNFAEPFSFSTGIDGVEGNVNAMTLSNIAWQQFFFWNGRVESLEEQVKDPILNPIEMHTTFDDVIEKLEQDAKYLELFERAYGTDEVTEDGIANALAQFIRTMISANSKFDQYIVGSYTLSPSEQLGFDIFNNEKEIAFIVMEQLVQGIKWALFGLLQFLQ